MVHRLRSTLAVKEERRIAQFLPVGPVFAVKIKCAGLFSDIESESCLTDLARRMSGTPLKPAALRDL